MRKFVAWLSDRWRGLSHHMSAVIRIARRILVPIFVVALGYVAYRIAIDFAQIRHALAGVSTLALLCGLGFAMLGVGSRAGYRLTLYNIAGYDRQRLPLRIAVQSFAWGQLLRYVPGKITGPATEVVLLERHLSWVTLFRITVFETFAMMLLSVFWLAASVLYVANWLTWALICLLAGICVTWVMHRHGIGLGRPADDRGRGPQLAWLATSMLIAEWLFYYGVWIAVAGAGWFVLATAYGAATWISAFVFVAPAGLGVRELAFAELAPHIASLSTADVFAQALILRLLQTAADVAMPLVLVAWNRGMVHE